MTTLPRLTEAMIRQRVDAESFRRGQEYARTGAVRDLVVRGNRLEADVEGSRPYPYRVRIDFDAAGLTGANCSCPLGGACKHVAAALLQALHHPEQVDARPPIAARLATLDRAQLHGLVEQLLIADPGLADVIEGFLPSLAPAAIDAGGPPVAGVRAATSDGAAATDAALPAMDRAALDPDSLSRQARRQRGGRRSSRDYDYWGGAPISDRTELTGQVFGFIDVGNPAAGLARLLAVTDEEVEQYEDYDDSDGMMGDSYAELGALWTEALLSVELTPAERTAWAEQIQEWADFLSEYGIDDVFGAATAAASYGWGDVPAADEDEDEWADEPAIMAMYADELDQARLNVLERQGRTAEFLALARARGHDLAYATKLVVLGRIEEAVAIGQHELTAPEALFALAQTLRESGHAEPALAIAERGLGHAEHHAPLAVWTRDLAAGLGQTERALIAAEAAFRAAPDLASYLAIAELAGDGWAARRDTLLTDLRAIRTRGIDGSVEVYLHEGLIDDAVRVADAHPYSWHLIRRVAEAAIPTHPEWVIRTCTAQAETIMDAGKADAYHYAADWLAKAKRAYEHSDRGDEWRSYLAGLITLHQRKYKLRPLLEALRR